MPTAMMFMLMVLSLWLPHSKAEHCRSTDPTPYRGLATKTPYSYLVGDRGLPAEVKSENCSVMQLWSLVRHGTRYPSKQAIRLVTSDLVLLRDKVVIAAKLGQGGLCHRDLEALTEWRVELNETQAKDLHPEGEMEMVLLGERFVSRFPGLFHDYQQHLFRFRSTNTQRSQASGRNYAIGLFGRAGNKVVFEDPILPHDPVIRSYKLCNKWKVEVKKNPQCMAERRMFETSKVMARVAKNITILLGLTEPLTMEDLDMMYVMCNFDQAWQPVSLSPWCSVFTSLQLKLMEYREDLEYYWVDGPAYPLTGAQSCPLLRDLYTSFHKVVKGEEGAHRGVFYFSHSGAVLKLLSLLELYRDKQELLADNFWEVAEGRSWNTSSIGPFGANVAFALKRCGDHFLVGLYVNEKLTPLPGCSEKVWCPWDTFVGLYPGMLECDFESVCRTEGKEDVEVGDDKY